MSLHNGVKSISMHKTHLKNRAEVTELAAVGKLHNTKHENVLY